MRKTTNLSSSSLVKKLSTELIYRKDDLNSSRLRDASSKSPSILKKKSKKTIRFIDLETDDVHSASKILNKV